MLCFHLHEHCSNWTSCLLPSSLLQEIYTCQPASTPSLCWGTHTLHFAIPCNGTKKGSQEIQQLLSNTLSPVENNVSYLHRPPGLSSLHSYRCSYPDFFQFLLVSLWIFSPLQAFETSISEKKKSVVRGALTHCGRTVQDKGRAEGRWHQVIDH